MTGTTSFARAAGAFWQMITVMVVGCFSVMLLIMAVQVLARYVFGIAVSWTDEASRYFFIVEIFLGAALAQRHQEHIRITILTDLLVPKAKRIAGVLADVICILVSAMLIAGAYGMMERTAGVYASTFDLSFSYVYLVQLAGLLLMMLLLMRDLYMKVFVADQWTPAPQEE